MHRSCHWLCHGWLYGGQSSAGPGTWGVNLNSAHNTQHKGVRLQTGANCFCCLRFEGYLFQTACSSSLHRCSVGLRSGLVEGHFRTLKYLVPCCFELFALTYYPVGRSLTCDWAKAFWHLAAHFTPESLESLVSSLYPASFLHPWLVWLVWFAKKQNFFLIYPFSQKLNAFWQIPVSFFS